MQSVHLEKNFWAQAANDVLREKRNALNEIAKRQKNSANMEWSTGGKYEQTKSFQESWGKIGTVSFYEASIAPRIYHPLIPSKIDVSRELDKIGILQSRNSSFMPPALLRASYAHKYLYSLGV